MRLLFVNYEFPPVGGGAAYASFEIAREFAALGHHVDFLTAATPGTSRDEQIDGVRIFRVHCHRRSIHDIGFVGALSFIVFAAPRLRALARSVPYDAYHYFFGLPTGILSCIPGAHRGKPYVVSLRGSDVPGYNKDLSAYHRLMLPITRRIWGGAYRVVANSYELRRLASAVMPQLRIDVIPNGAKRTSAPRAPRAADAGFRILTVSRLIERKGVDTLIEALARTGDARLSLDVAGEGPKRSSLRELADARGVGARVHFHGFADRAAIASLHARADVFVLMSRAESCSMALLEAMAAGVPVVASRVGGNAELVTDGTNGLLLPPEDVDELARTLSRLAADALLRERLAAAGRALIERNFNRTVMARAYADIFEQATGGTRSAGAAHRMPAQPAAPEIDR
jgi:glycosyltransferase involved in cell wall biosynthesis